MMIFLEESHRFRSKYLRSVWCERHSRNYLNGNQTILRHSGACVTKCNFHIYAHTCFRQQCMFAIKLSLFFCSSAVENIKRKKPLKSLLTNTDTKLCKNSKKKPTNLTRRLSRRSLAHCLILFNSL